MGVKKEWLAGDTNEFALKIALEDDPDNSYGAFVEESASWGYFQIWVKGHNLCRHRVSDLEYDAVHWYLLPLLEWFAKNWDPIFHEERLPIKNDIDAASGLAATQFPDPMTESDESKAEKWESDWRTWWSRHALLSCREGGLFPNVVFRRWRDLFEISWQMVRLAGMPPDFHFIHERGRGRIACRAVAESIYEVIGQAVATLIKENPESERVKRLAADVAGLPRKTGKKEKKRLAWLAGLDIDGSKLQSKWTKISNKLLSVDKSMETLFSGIQNAPLVLEGSCQAALMFGSLSPQITQSDALNVAGKIVSLSSEDTVGSRMDYFVETVPLQTTLRPWEQGYELAEKLLDRLGPPTLASYVDVENILKDQLGVIILNVEISDETTRGMAVASPTHRPGILINTRSFYNYRPTGRRFTMAHEFCHLLYDREQGKPIALASGPWAPVDIEKRANAFAAMLLMPTILVSDTIGKINQSHRTAAGISELSNRLKVHPLALQEHLVNLGFLDSETENKLATEWVDRFQATQ